MPKIVFVSYNYYPPSYSGKLMMACKRLQDLAALGFEIVVYTSGLKDCPGREGVGGVQMHRSPYVGDGKLSGRLTRLGFWIWSLVKLSLEKDVSFVHFDEYAWISLPLLPAFSLWGAWTHFSLLAMIAHHKHAKTLFEHAISDETGHFSPTRWSAHFFDQIDYIVCVSDALYEAVCQVYPQKANKIVYGIEEDVFAPMNEKERKSFRSEQGVGENDIVLCFMGLVVKRKGFDLIVEVFPDFVNEYPNSFLWCIGPRNRLESPHIHDDLIAQLQAPLEPVRDRVKFWGRVDDRQSLVKILGAADIFLFPTNREGMPLAPLEAMATGMPIIISNIPGVTDLANIDGETGFYMTPGNAHELRQAMAVLAGDKHLRQTMGANARQRVVEHFSWSGHVARWEYFLNQQAGIE